MRRPAWVGIGLVVALSALPVAATPSTNIWNPSTDIQAKDVFHLGMDNYVSAVRNRTDAIAFGTDFGLTYGLGHGFELGIDLIEPNSTPVFFNIKWGLPEHGDYPAVAVGCHLIGLTNRSGADMTYGLVSKNIEDLGRLTLGGYYANPGSLRSALNGGADNAGLIAAWDRSVGDKWWFSIDYASGQNYMGALALGGSYRFAENVSAILGYVIFNDKTWQATTANPTRDNDTVTAQVDIDF